MHKCTKKGQVIFKNNLTYKAPLVGSRSNRFWKDLKKFREWKSHSSKSGFFVRWNHFIIQLVSGIWLLMNYVPYLRKMAFTKENCTFNKDKIAFNKDKLAFIKAKMAFILSFMAFN